MQGVVIALVLAGAAGAAFSLLRLASPTPGAARAGRSSDA